MSQNAGCGSSAGHEHLSLELTRLPNKTHATSLATEHVSVGQECQRTSTGQLHGIRRDKYGQRRRAKLPSGHAETSGQDLCSTRCFAAGPAPPPGHAETSGPDLCSARRFADQANHLGMLEAVGRIFAAQGALQKDQANHLGMPKPAVRIFAARGALPGPDRRSRPVSGLASSSRRRWATRMSAWAGTSSG